jgi:hypothetical protein
MPTLATGPSPKPRSNKAKLENTTPLRRESQQREKANKGRNHPMVLNTDKNMRFLVVLDSPKKTGRGTCIKSITTAENRQLV